MAEGLIELAEIDIVERVCDYLAIAIRAIAREEAQHAANQPTAQWEAIDPDAAMDNLRIVLAALPVNHKLQKEG